MPKKFGLSPKLILNNFLILSVSLVVVIFISNRAFEMTLYQLVGNELKNYADETAFAIDHYILDCIEEIKVISQADVFEQKDPQAMTQYLNEVLHESSKFKILLVVNNEKDLISSTDNANDKDIKPFLRSLLKNPSSLIWSSEKQGEVYYADHLRINDLFYPILLTPLTDDTNLIVEGTLVGFISISFIQEEVFRIDDRTIGKKSRLPGRRSG